MKFAIIGAGGFADFSSAAILETGQFECTGIYDINTENAENLASKIQAPIIDDLDAFLESDKADLFYIATPPYLHYSISKKALKAKKHVICEKPGSLSKVGMETLIRYAKENKVLFAVHLMQAYNPIIQQVEELISRGLLGRFRHGYFENYAGGASLDRFHWLWDEKKSGGIFVEHAVHFFDMFQRWFGPGKLISSNIAGGMHTLRTNQYNRVQAIVQYADSWVNFYHGFDQASEMDRQEMRLLFEHGDITLQEWVPVKMTIRGYLPHNHIEEIAEIIQGEVLTEQRNDEGPAKFVMRLGHKSLKLRRYREIIQAFFIDQKNFIENKEHERLVTSRDALEALSLGIECRKHARIV